MAKQVVQGLNADGVTINIYTSGDNVAGNATEAEPKLQANVVFGNKEVTIGDFLLQDGSLVKLVFRELVNGNRAMVATGFEYGGKWYGDRPDNGKFEDVFSGKTMLVEGDTIIETEPDISNELEEEPKLDVSINASELVTINYGSKTTSTIEFTVRNNTNEVLDNVTLTINKLARGDNTTTETVYKASDDIEVNGSDGFYTISNLLPQKDITVSVALETSETLTLEGTVVFAGDADSSNNTASKTIVHEFEDI